VTRGAFTVRVKEELAALRPAAPAERRALLAALLGDDLDTTAAADPAPVSRREAGALVKGYVEFHLDRRLRAYPLVTR